MLPSSVDFNQNKLILSLIKNKFSNEEKPLSSIVEDFAHDTSSSRTSLCEAFRLFGNAKYTWFSGGENDIRALCQGILTGYQSANARHFKNAVLAKTRFFIENNDKKSFFDLCQSIYRSAQQNAPTIYNTDNEFQFEDKEDFYEFEEENESSLSLSFSNLYNFYVEVTPFEDENKVRVGNRYKKKTKKTLKSPQLYLFEGIA
jgi:hypothetical protein